MCLQLLNRTCSYTVLQCIVEFNFEYRLGNSEAPSLRGPLQTRQVHSLSGLCRQVASSMDVAIAEAFRALHSTGSTIHGMLILRTM